MSSVKWQLYLNYQITRNSSDVISGVSPSGRYMYLLEYLHMLILGVDTAGNTDNAWEYFDRAFRLVLQNIAL